ncbi:hypothetical protein HDU97_007087 [Phlyctochytrium planicorne]|nr:hypothetical protein HDU97_007087 [Phlyctochytrium planicorne]
MDKTSSKPCTAAENPLNTFFSSNPNSMSPTKTGRLARMKLAPIKKSVSSPTKLESMVGRAEGSFEKASPMKPLTTSALLKSQSDTTEERSAPSFTYGETRSFLAETEAEAMPARESYSTFVKRYKDEGLDSSDSDDDMSKKIELKRVHELRGGGESKRFSDEFDYLLSGLQPNQTKNVRTSSYFELLRKIANPNFSAKLKTHNFMSKIIVSIIASIVLLLGDEFFYNFDLHPIMPSLTSGLFLEYDPFAKPPKSKYEVALLKDIKGVVAKELSFENSVNVTSLCLPAISILLKVIEINESRYTEFLESLSRILLQKLNLKSIDPNWRCYSLEALDILILRFYSIFVDSPESLSLLLDILRDILSGPDESSSKELTLALKIAVDLTASSGRLSMELHAFHISGLISSTFRIISNLNRTSSVADEFYGPVQKLGVVLLLNLVHTVQGSGSLMLSQEHRKILDVMLELYEKNDGSVKPFLAMLVGSLLQAGTNSKGNEEEICLSFMATHPSFLESMKVTLRTLVEEQKSIMATSSSPLHTPINKIESLLLFFEKAK